MYQRLLKIILPLVVLGISVTTFMFMLKTKGNTQAVEIHEQTWTVATQTVEKGVHTPYITLYGLVETPREAGLTAAVAAQVNTVAVLEGMSVSQGELLVRLDEQDLRLALQQRTTEVTEINSQLEVEQRKHRYNQAALPHERTLQELSKRAVERAQRLQKNQAVSQSALDEAQQNVARQSLVIQARELELATHAARIAQLQAKLTRAKTAQAQTELELQRCRISAPFAGTIAALQVAEGDRVRVGDKLLTLFDHNALEIRAQIPQNYVAQIEQSISAGHGLDAQIMQLNLPASLHRLSGQVNAKSGGIDGLFRMPEGSPHRLRLAQFVSLRLALLQVSDSVALPTEALYDQRKVYVLEENRMKGIVVEKIGDFQLPDGRTGVLVHSDTLQDGATLIITRLPNAMDGLKVSPRSL